MKSDFKIFSRFGSTLEKFVRISSYKLDTLSVVNIIILFALILFVAIESLGNSILAIVYAFIGSVGQLFGKTVIPTVDTTPFYFYAIFVGLGFIICLFMVKKHQDGKLW